MNVIGRGVRNILNFKGRDRRGQFWPYLAVVMVLTITAYAIISPTVVYLLSQNVNGVEYASVSGELLIVNQQMQMEAFQKQMSKFLSGIWGMTAVFVLANIALLAAAVARRLHDRGHSGWWAAIVPVLLMLGGTIFSYLFMSAPMSGDGPTATFLLTFLAVFALMALYNISLIVLIVFLCLKGKTGPNRYGPEPV